MRVFGRAAARLVPALCLLAVAAPGRVAADPQAGDHGPPPAGAARDATPKTATPNTATPKPAAPKPAAPKPAASGPQAKPEPSPAAQQGTSAVVMDLSAIDSVIGKTVKSEGGEDLGHIVDLLVTTSGQVRAAVLDFGGVLGVGTRKIAVDWKALEFANVAKDGVVRLALTRNQVRVAPEYKAGDPVVIIEASKAEAPKAPPPPNGGGGEATSPPPPVSTPQAGAPSK